MWITFPTRIPLTGTGNASPRVVLCWTNGGQIFNNEEVHF